MNYFEGQEDLGDSIVLLQVCTGVCLRLFCAVWCCVVVCSGGV